jgi:serine/threonine protein kinase/WD40 repeat protein
VDTLLGTTLDGYVLKRLLGSGGMGAVYLAEDPSIGQQVAIKVVRTDDSNYSDTASLEQATERFRQEARAVGGLDHLNILPLYRYGEEETSSGRRAYIVMQYRPEGSLADWLRRRAGKFRPSSQTLTPQLPEGLPTSWPLGLEETAYYIYQAASALQYAHDRGIIHRDVKPANFLLRFDPHITNKAAILLLSDFGLAKFYAVTSATSHAFGTPIYMAPEQFDGTASPQSDQYALAIMAFHLLAGHPPFEGDPMHLMLQHLRTEPPSLHTLVPTVPRSTDEVLHRALAKQADQRFPSIMNFAEAFKEASHSNASRTLLRPFTLPTLPAVHQPGEITHSRNNIFRASTALPPAPQSEHLPPAALSPYATERHDFSTMLKGPQDQPLQAQTEIPQQTAMQQMQQARAFSPSVQSQPMTPQPSTMPRQELPAPRHDEQRTSRRHALNWIFGGAALLAIGTGTGIFIARREHTPGPPSVVSSNVNPQAIMPDNRTQPKLLQGHTGEVTSVAWSPDGRFLASGSADNSVRLWNIDEQQSQVFSGHKAEIFSVAWAPDSSLLASGGEDTTVRIWDQHGPSQYAPIEAGAIVNSLAWQHDNSTLFAGTIGKGLYEMYPQASRALPKLNKEQISIRAVALSPDGLFLATGDDLGLVKLYQLPALNLLFARRLHQKPVLTLAWSPDGSQLASGAADRHLQIVEVSTTFTLLHTFTHRASVTCIAWNPGDSRQIATITNDGNLYLWSTLDGHFNIYKSRTSLATSLTWGIKGLVTGMRDGTIAIWGHLTSSPLPGTPGNTGQQ